MRFLRIKTAAGEFEVKISQAKQDNAGITLEGKATALWSPLPMMGVWDMKMSADLRELIRVGGLLAPVLCLAPFRLLYSKVRRSSSAGKGN